MGVTVWLTKKDKKEGGIIRQNLKKRDRVWLMKKGWRYYHFAKISHKKKIKKTYVLNSFKLLRRKLETCNQIYIHKNIMISGIWKALISSMFHLQINKENLLDQT